MNQYLAWFNEIPDEELGGAAGGKGASLCRMSRAGLPVPTGFIVRSEMFNAFMEANGLWDYVYEKLAEIDFTSDASLISVAAKIRQRIIDSPVPEEMACEKVDSLASAMDTSMAWESSRMRSCRRAVAEMSRMFL